MAEPKCPSCGVQGIEKIVVKESDLKNGAGDSWFEIVHCNDCGHVYGVFAKRVISHQVSPKLPPLAIPKLPL